MKNKPKRVASCHQTFNNMEAFNKREARNISARFAIVLNASNLYRDFRNSEETGNRNALWEHHSREARKKSRRT
jgi:hypothetical protein